jgi:DNA-binding transcriptional LysR family regulator
MRWHIPTDVRYARLHNSRLVFFVAKHHPLANNRRPSLEEVAAAGLIAAPLDSAERAYYGAVLREAGVLRYRVALEVDGIQARILAAQEGLGVLGTFWPPYVGEAALPGLHALPLAHGLGGPEFGLVSDEGDPQEPLVAAFAAWLGEVASGQAV